MIKNIFVFFLMMSPSYVRCFQLEDPQGDSARSKGLTDFQKLEAGLIEQRDFHSPLYYLAVGDYENSLTNVDYDLEKKFPWLRDYLENLIRVSQSLRKTESRHFVLYVPPGQEFLADYALPALELVGDAVVKRFGHRPSGKVRVEIYPTKEDFSLASTLSEEILERSGAIGICKFHRLMILSPKALPLGYRWMDALSHEFMHLVINELTHSEAELWVHEGTARYFETAYRSDPPIFLTPRQKTNLLEAEEKGTLISFDRMSPSMVYLKNQEEVSLAFAQVSHAISFMIQEKGFKKFVLFLETLRNYSFPVAFKKIYGKDPRQFEDHWKIKLAEEDWEKTRGALSDEIRFTQIDETAVVGADVQGRMRLGDKMRQKGLLEAALIEYEKALSEEPDNAILLLKAARVHLALGQREMAVQNLRRAIEKNPNYGTPYIELSKWVSPMEAVGILKEANAINPFDPRIHEMLMVYYGRLGRAEEAKREGEIYRSLVN